MHEPNFDLTALIAPTDPDLFLRETWEKQPLHISRRQPGFYAHFMTLADVDDVIAFSRPKFVEPATFSPAEAREKTYVKGWLADRQAPEGAHFPGIGELRRVYQRGKTIVIMTMQQRRAAVASLCRNLEGLFHCPVHANLYLTPPRAQGFDAHFDPHEVFVMQLEGSKTWRLFGPGREAPLIDERFEVARSSLGPPRTFDLEAGDLLYIPRGHVHEAFTSDVASLHLTVGVNVYRWVDLLHEALAGLARQDARFRASLPPGSLAGDVPGAMKERFAELLGALGQATIDEPLRRLGDRFFGQMPLLPGCRFAAAEGESSLALDTILEKAPGMICRVVQDGGWVAIEFPGGNVGGPGKIASSLRMVARADRFAVRELADELGDAGKLVLAGRLVREGLLRIVAPAAIDADRIAD